MTTLIPRKVIFGNPDKARVRISKDGKYISYIAPLNGVLNVYVAAIESPDDAKPVTNDTGRGIRVYSWAHDDKHLLYLKDNKGDENWHLYTVNIEDLTTRDLTDFPDTCVNINRLSHLFPNEVVIEMNRRRKDLFDLYVLDLTTGSIRELFQNDEYYTVITDHHLKLRFAHKIHPDTTSTYYEFDEDNTPSEFMKLPADDFFTTAILDFDEENNLYMKDSIGRNTAALVLFNLDTKEKTLLYENKNADIENEGYSSSLMLHPTKKHLQALGYNYLRQEIKVFDKSLEPTFAKIEEVITGDLQILSRSLDDNVWIFSDDKDNGPISYYQYNRVKEEIKFLFYNRKNLLNYELWRCSLISVIIE